MFKRRLLPPALLTALVLAATPAVPALAADGDCAVAVAQPATVSITAPSMSVPAVLRDAPAACAAYASFDVLRSDGADTDIVIFDSGRGDNAWTLSTTDGPGRYHLRFRNGHDHAYDDVVKPVDSNELAAKFSSRLSAVKTSRKKSTAKLTATASQYRYFVGYKPAKGRSVVFEKKTASGWSAAKTVRTGKNGVATWTAKSTRSTKWRARLLESSTAWGAPSDGTSPSTGAPAEPTPTAPVKPTPAPAPVAPPASAPVAPPIAAPAPTPTCPTGRLYGTPVSATATDPGSYSSSLEVRVTGWIRNDASRAVELDALAPEVIGYDASGFQLLDTYATADYPQQYLSSSNTYVLQPSSTVTWTATTYVEKSDWPRVRTIEGSPVRSYDSKWADSSISSSCAAPAQDYATRPFLRR